MTNEDITRAKGVLERKILEYKPEGINGNCNCDSCNNIRPVYKALEVALSCMERLEKAELKSYLRLEEWNKANKEIIKLRERLGEADVTNTIFRMENKKIGGCLESILKLIKESKTAKYYDQTDVSELQSEIAKMKGIENNKNVEIHCIHKVPYQNCKFCIPTNSGENLT